MLFYFSNNRGIDAGEDLPKEYLESIYERIQAQEFRSRDDPTTVLQDLAGNISSKVPVELVHPARIYLCEATAVELAKGSNKPKKNVTLMLFNDTLLVLSKSKTGKKKQQLRLGLSLFEVEISPSISSCYELVYLNSDRASATSERASAFRWQFTAVSATEEATVIESGVFLDKLERAIQECRKIEEQRAGRSVERQSSFDGRTSPSAVLNQQFFARSLSGQVSEGAGQDADAGECVYVYVCVCVCDVCV